DTIITGTTATFAQTLNADSTANNRTLLVNGTSTVFQGAIGNTGVLASLTTDAAGTTDLNGGTIDATTVDFQDDVILSADTVITGTTATFAKTVNADATGNNRTLLVNGTSTVFQGAIGDTGVLASLTTDAAGTTDLNGGTINATTVNFQDDVILSADTIITGTTATFGQTVNADSAANNRTLLINGATSVFNGAIGDTGILASLTTDGAGMTSLSGGAINATTVTFHDAVVLGVTNTINATTVSFDGNVDALSAGGQGLTVNASATTTFGDAAADAVGTTQLAFLTTDASGTTRINAANISTTGDQTFNDTVVLGNSTTLIGSSISFNSTLDATSAGVEGLTVQSSNDVLFSGAVGGSTQLGNLQIVTARNVTESTSVSATSLVQQAGSGLTLLNGPVTTTSASGVQLTTNQITINAPISTTGDGIVMLTNAGLLTVNANIAADGAITQDGAGPVTITEPRSMTTTGDAVTFTTAVTLSGSNNVLDIDTTLGGHVTGANVQFQSTVHGSTGGANSESLSIDAGTSGQITITGAADNLKDVTIVNSGHTTFQSSLQADTVLITNTTGTVSFQGNTSLATLTTTNQPYNVTFGKSGGPVVTDIVSNPVNFLNTGAVNVGLNSGDQVTFSAGVVHTAGVTNVVGTLTTLTGGVTLGTTTLNGTIATQGQQVFVQGVTLTGAGIVNTAFNNAAGADITFNSSVDALNAGVQDLTVNAGTGGNVLFTGAVGTAARVGHLVISNAHDVIGQAAVSATTFTQSAGTGTTTLNGAVDTTTSGGIALTTNVITLNNTLTTTGTGGVTLTNSGLLTINGNVNSDGAVTQNGAGSVTITPPIADIRSITTTADAVSFLRAVAIVGSGSLLSIDTTASGHTAGGNVTFSSTLNASTSAPNAERLLINAGTGGDVLLVGSVGGFVRLGDIVITDAHNVTESGGITAASLTQTTGTGLTKLDGVVDTNTSTGIALTNGSLAINNIATATTQIVLTAINPNGNININSTLQTTQPAGTVSMTALHGGIVNGAAANVVNVNTNSLVMQATAGIGSSGTALQTTVATLAAHNSGSGNIRVDNLSTQLLTIDTVAGVKGITNDGASLGSITVTNNSSILVSPTASATNGPVTNTTGGNITLMTNGGAFDITVNSPIAASGGNGNITLNAGRNLVVNDTTIANDISTTGTGTTYLVAATHIQLGSMDPNSTTDTTQHTTPNDVIIKSGTGSITNTLPLVYNIQSPQITATGEVVLSGDFGRPGEHNFTVTVYWGDGTSTTQVFADAGQFSFSHIYHGNPNKDDQSAPILINVQVAHDPHIVLNAPNVNSPTESVPDIGVSNPPPVPSPNINSDLSGAIYNPSNPNYVSLHGANTKIVTATGNEANPGTVLYQDISIRATAVPVPGEGLASFPYDVTPPVVFLHFPEQSPVIDHLSHTPPPPAQGDSLRLDLINADEGVAAERSVFLEILREDGTIERIRLPEDVLDDLLKVVANLPDGRYRFQLLEPGESRLRLLMDLFEVRQGKIVDENDEGDRPPSSGIRHAKPASVEGDAAADADEAVQRSSLQTSEIGPEFEHLTQVEPISKVVVETDSRTVWNGWSSTSARRAWRRAERMTDDFVQQTGLVDELPDSGIQTDESATDSDSTIASHGTEAQANAGAVFLVGATVAGALVTTTGTGRRGPQEVAARLSRAARLFRKFATKPK
ncbi:MAG: hypothetical protein JSS49_26005, partial [Planctomycetes bacterium]|nr:hypothetical protein [Planctomycetota bacterium]